MMAVVAMPVAMMIVVVRTLRLCGHRDEEQHSKCGQQNLFHEISLDKVSMTPFA
jgi:hypothetical protein